ncbi:MAG: HAMP domain-containing sensor histidine kinase [Candidatus Acidiferrales bacterium]
MSFRFKLLLAFTLTVGAAVGLVAWGVSSSTRTAFQTFEAQRSQALLAQFQSEFAQRGDVVVHRIASIADSEATVRMALDLSRTGADSSVYVNDAQSLAKSFDLDFLDFTTDDGMLVSSAEWPARFGYKNDWVTSESDWNQRNSFLARVETADNVQLGLLAVRVVPVEGKNLYVFGGERLDKNFLATLVLPAGMRALLYSNLEQSFEAPALNDASGPVNGADRFQSLVNTVQQQNAPASQTIWWSADPADKETFSAIPLRGRKGDLLGIFLVGSSQRDLVTELAFIRSLAILVGGVGILFGIVVSWWIAARVTRPLSQLSRTVDQVAAGNWAARVDVRSRDEVGRLGTAFNNMTQELAEQRDRLIQAERVAAWREVARRLAHELKNPLFPLQITVENLQRARELDAEQFDEIFVESTGTLRAELETLKAIVARFADFAKMPQPEFESVDLNEIARAVVRLFEPQFSTVGRPQITTEFALDDRLPRVDADPLLLHKALENLVVNALDAMPSGGALTVRTRRKGDSAELEISDTGAGLTPEEHARLFTPYSTTKPHGTGLGLAIVQSVVTDHGGTVDVESAPGKGTTFRILLPLVHRAQQAQAAAVNDTQREAL